MGTIQQSEESNPWSVTLTVNGTPIEFMIDTGANVTVIPMNILQMMLLLIHPQEPSVLPAVGLYG